MRKPFPVPRVCAGCKKPRGTAAYIRKIKSTNGNDIAYLCRRCVREWQKEGDKL